MLRNEGEAKYAQDPIMTRSEVHFVKKLGII